MATIGWYLLLDTWDGDCAEDVSPEGIACSLVVEGEVGILMGKGTKMLNDRVASPCCSFFLVDDMRALAICC